MKQLVLLSLLATWPVPKLVNEYHWTDKIYCNNQSECWREVTYHHWECPKGYVVYWPEINIITEDAKPDCVPHNFLPNVKPPKAGRK